LKKNIQIWGNLVRFNKTFLKSCSILVLLLVFSAPASSGQFFIGSDATTFNARVQFGNTNNTYITDPILRVKFGYFWNWAGLEFNVLTPSEGTTDVLGFPTTFELGTSYGMYLALQQDWIYGRVGVTWLDTTLTRTGVDRYEITAPTISLGIQHNFGRHFRVNFGYTYIEGTGRYPNNTAPVPPGFSGSITDPTVNVSGFELGFNVLF
jgi:hypothetical protein